MYSTLHEHRVAKNKNNNVDRYYKILKNLSLQRNHHHLSQHKPAVASTPCIFQDVNKETTMKGGKKLPTKHPNHPRRAALISSSFPKGDTDAQIILLTENMTLWTHADVAKRPH